MLDEPKIQQCVDQPVGGCLTEADRLCHLGQARSRRSRMGKDTQDRRRPIQTLDATPPVDQFVLRQFKFLDKKEMVRYEWWNNETIIPNKNVVKVMKLVALCILARKVVLMDPYYGTRKEGA